jgi:hypothetical protein
MIKLFSIVFFKSLINVLKISRNIFFIAATLQLVFAFVLIFTSFLDSYMNATGDPSLIRFFSIAISFIYLMLHQLIGILLEKIEEEAWYRS